MYKEKYKEKVYNKGKKIILVNGLQTSIFLKHIQLKEDRVFDQCENNKIV